MRHVWVLVALGLLVSASAPTIAFEYGPEDEVHGEGGGETMSAMDSGGSNAPSEVVTAAKALYGNRIFALRNHDDPGQFELRVEQVIQ